MQRLEVSGAVRPIYGLLGVKRLRCWLCEIPEWKRNFLSYFHRLKKNSIMRTCYMCVSVNV